MMKKISIRIYRNDDLLIDTHRKTSECKEWIKQFLNSYSDNARYDVELRDPGNTDIVEPFWSFYECSISKALEWMDELQIGD